MKWILKVCQSRLKLLIIRWTSPPGTRKYLTVIFLNSWVLDTSSWPFKNIYIIPILRQREVYFVDLVVCLNVMFWSQLPSRLTSQFYVICNISAVVCKLTGHSEEKLKSRRCTSWGMDCTGILQDLGWVRKKKNRVLCRLHYRMNHVTS